MSRKKLSIHDVLREDRTQLTSLEASSPSTQPDLQSEKDQQKELSSEEQKAVQETGSVPSKRRKPRGRPPKKRTENPVPNPLSKERESKADYVRLSVTLPPELFDRLQMVSIQRRRRKESYTFCHLVREAIQEWIDEAEEK